MTAFTKNEQAILKTFGEIIGREVRRLEAKIDAQDGAGKLLRVVEGLRCQKSVRDIKAWVRGVAHSKSITTSRDTSIATPAHLAGLFDE